jgi:oxaloacetate decarboxylase gamma subunit
MGNIVDGFKLMAIGMGMVFFFLALMVIIMQIVAKLLAPYAHIFDEPASSSKSKKRSQPKKSTGNKDEVVTAITAAVHKYRAEH